MKWPWSRKIPSPPAPLSAPEGVSSPASQANQDDELSATIDKLLVEGRWEDVAELADQFIEKGNPTWATHLLDKIAGMEGDYVYVSAKKEYEYALARLVDRGAKPSEKNAPALIEKISKTDFGRDIWPYRRLLAAGVSPNTRMSDGKPWIIHAIQSGYTKVALVLLEEGAHLHPDDPDTASALRDLFSLRFHDAISSPALSLDKMLFGAEPWRTGKKVGSHSLPENEGSRDGGFEHLATKLAELGFDPNAVDCKGCTAYALTSARGKKILQELFGDRMLPTGKMLHGSPVAVELVVDGEIEELGRVLGHNPTALLEFAATGELVAWKWWCIQDPHRANQMVALFKQTGQWDAIVSATSSSGQNFLTYGLSWMLGNLKKDEEESLKTMEWKLARMETELHSILWAGQDEAGETANFWLSQLKNTSLLEKYVLPRRAAYLDQMTRQVDNTRPPAPTRRL